MGEYTRAVSRQRFGKHVARQQILNNVTVGLQQRKRGVFYVVLAERLYARQGLQLSQLSISSVLVSVKR
jgi:hypothetical protein